MLYTVDGSEIETGSLDCHIKVDVKNSNNRHFQEKRNVTFLVVVVDSIFVVDNIETGVRVQKLISGDRTEHTVNETTDREIIFVVFGRIDSVLQNFLYVNVVSDVCFSNVVNFGFFIRKSRKRKYITINNNIKYYHLFFIKYLS